MNNPSVEELIQYREEAIRNLLDEKAKHLHQLESLQSQIKDVETKLQLLGFHENTQSQEPKLRERSVSKSSDGYTLEMLLEGKQPKVVSLYHQLSEGITALESSINSIIRKKYVAFSKDRNFCEVVVWVSKLTIFIDIPISILNDPENIAEDCSNVGRWATGQTRFHLLDAEGIDYSMDLIKQSHRYNMAGKFD